MSKDLMKFRIVGLMFVCLLALSHVGSAQTTTFSYQGKFDDGGTPATGTYDFTFRLFDSPSGGSQIGSNVIRNDVQVTAGIFTVLLDFGSSPFTSLAAGHLEIEVRPGASTGAYTTLAPRQQLAAAPYAIRAFQAASADNATQLGGIAASQYVMAGSSNFIQNQNAGAQAASNFNISGTGTANIVNAVTQYNLNSTRILSYPGLNNIFVGASAGNGNTTGNNNSFVGSLAGFANTSGTRNSYFGSEAGFLGTTNSDNSMFGYQAGRVTNGSSNSFFGSRAGDANSTGASNSFFGTDAGGSNTTGFENSFFGESAGLATTTGDFNAFFGRDAGRANTTATSNTFIGHNTGSATTTGVANTFLGKGAGTGNTIGSNNTLIGYNAEVSTSFGTINFATAIGSGAVATNSNSLVLGRSSDYVEVPGNALINGNVTTDTLRIVTLLTQGVTNLCRNMSNQVAVCVSSLRYKTNIAPFSPGMSLVHKLRPITFDWKDGGMHDLGLGAEDVAAIEPLLVTYNDKGQVEGVKYDRIGLVLVNAVKEQQEQIDTQQKEIAERKGTEQRLQTQIDAQQKQIDDLKQIVCSFKPDAVGCLAK